MLTIQLALVIPAAYHSAKIHSHVGTQPYGLFWESTTPDLDPIDQHGLLVISRGTAIILLAVYVVYLWFQVHRRSFCVAVPLR